jgi:tetratricopeptide (TPR) repeat protein
VLFGGCQRHGGHEPYAPLPDALRNYVAGQDLPTLERHLEGCAWLVQLVPELAGGPLPPLTTHSIPSDQQRRLMVGAVQRYLGNVTGPAGTLLLLDDLQWAGRDALDLLTTLLCIAIPGRSRSAPLRIVGAYRDTEVHGDHPLALLLSDIVPTEQVQEERLEPLSTQEATELFTALLPDRDRARQDLSRRIIERTGGVPFSVVSYAHARRGTHGPGEDGPLRWNLRQSIQQRVSMLGPYTRDLLGVMSVIGRAAGVGLLLEVAGDPESEITAALDEACRMRLLVEDGRSGYQFLHDLIREVVEADLGAARRAVLHRTVAEALERMAGDVPAELLAYHYGRSDAPDRSLSYLELAGDHAVAQHAHDSAGEHYRALLDRLEGLDGRHHAARVRLKLGEVLARTGRYDAALPILEQAASALQALGDSEGLARAAAAIGAANGRRGTNTAGIARMRMLLEVLEQTDASVPLAAAYEVLGHALRDEGKYPEALAASTRAAELANAFGDRRSGVLAEWTRVEGLSALGHMSSEEAYDARRRTLSQIEAIGDLELLSGAHYNLAYACVHRGDLATAREHIDRAVAAAEELGDPGELAFALAIRGWVAFLRGDWRRARTSLEGAVGMSRELDQSWCAPYILLWLAELSLAEGDRAAAATSGQEAKDLAEQNGDLQALRLVARVMAELDIVEGRPEAAISRVIPLLDDRGQEDHDVTALLPVQARACLQCGQVDQAVETVEQAITRVRRDGARLALIDALRAQVMVALRTERLDMAEQCVVEGLALARGMSYPYGEALLLQLDGERLAASGEPSKARTRRQEAFFLFQRLGARRDAEETRVASAPGYPGTPAIPSC